LIFDIEQRLVLPIEKRECQKKKIGNGNRIGIGMGKGWPWTP
jgi:hypothetical protein